jgi:hypothetical protein
MNSSVIAVGFWLPCGKGNFYFNSKDIELLTAIQNHSGDIGKIKNLYRADNKLQCSVFHRLFEVLPEGEFEKVVPIFSKSRKGDFKSNPEGVIYYSKNPDGIEIIKNQKSINKILFISNDQGFNLIIAHVTGSDPDEKEIKNTLTAFILEKIDKKSKILDGRTFKDNIENYLGILPFFQLNLILEGLFNDNYNPRNFFSSSGTLDATEKHPLKGFSRRIISQSIVLNSEETQSLQDFLDDPNIDRAGSFHDQIFDTSNQDDNVLLTIVTHFLRSISTDCLLTLKWHIESCRRALLDSMLSSVHKQDKLEQLESKDKDAEAIDMEHANEAQLRGYAMFIAAKFPLIMNVDRYIRRVCDEIKDMENDNELDLFLKDWCGLTSSIQDNISRLEEAISQSKVDNLLLEQQQIRAESETMAEIERVRERNTIEGDGENSAISLTNNHIAIMALLLAVFLVIKIRVDPSNANNYQELYIVVFQFLDNFIQLGRINSIVCIAVLSLILIFWSLFYRIRKIYIFVFISTAILAACVPSVQFLIHLLALFTGATTIFFLGKFFEEGGRKSNKKNINLRNNRQYYYEMDLRIQAPIKDEKVAILISDSFRPTPGILRDSYRAEYFQDNEAHHKIYFEAPIALSQDPSLPTTKRITKREEIIGIYSTISYLVKYKMDPKSSILPNDNAIDSEANLFKKIEKKWNFTVGSINGFPQALVLNLVLNLVRHPLLIKETKISYFLCLYNVQTIKFMLRFIDWQRTKMTAYITYDVIRQKRASTENTGDVTHFLNEFRFVGLTSKKLSNAQINEIKEMVKKEFINSLLEDTYQLKNIERLSIFHNKTSGSITNSKTSNQTTTP